MKNNTSLYLLASFFMFSVMIGPGCASKGLPDCPDGQVLSTKGKCIPVAGDAIEDEDTPVEDTAADEIQGEILADGETDWIDTAREDSVEADWSVIKGQIGAPCMKKEECTSQLCLANPGGYCAQVNCDDNTDPCPTEAVCIDLGIKTCLRTCLMNADCRESEGYACKSFRKDGKEVRACRPSGDLDIGDACTADSECPGQAVCLDSLKKGYCSRLYCSETVPCPENSHCVLFDATMSCMKACELSGECREDDSQSCIELDGPASQKAKVCAMTEGAIKIGEQCEVDLDCSTKNCELISKGYCNNPEKTLCVSDAECPQVGMEAGECVNDPLYVFGYCTKSCTSLFTQGACPDNAVCANFGGQGKCIASCSDENKCRETIGFACLPGGELAVPVYGCVVQDGGEVGGACKADPDCDEGYTCDLSKNGGYCTKTCGIGIGQAGTLDCIYPGVCVDDGGLGKCAKRCYNSLDCRENYECKTVGMSPDVCWPKIL